MNPCRSRQGRYQYKEESVMKFVLVKLNAIDQTKNYSEFQANYVSDTVFNVEHNIDLPVIEQAIFGELVYDEIAYYSIMPVNYSRNKVVFVYELSLCQALADLKIEFTIV